MFERLVALAARKRLAIALAIVNGTPPFAPQPQRWRTIDEPDVRRIIGDRKAYLTFDIDCLDPSYAPGTGTPVCGGLTTHQALSILRGLAGVDVIGMDMVEVAPAYDVGEITALAAASLCMEMLYLYACRPGG